MIEALARLDRRRMQNIYAKMSEGAGKCVSGCYKCCSDIATTYIEFLYLASGFDWNELKRIAEKPKIVAKLSTNMRKEENSGSVA